LAYGQSKTANILFAAALVEKLKGRGILAFSVGPGCMFYPPFLNDFEGGKNAD
jgi:NAD(P)-dependent dehydrogenase (short-subunit alcohol dehydrogenase family)